MIAPITQPPAIHAYIEYQNSISDDMQKAYNNFVETHPTLTQPSYVDKLRATDYGRLDRLHQIYLDYTGGSLYADSQIKNHMKILFNNVFGNPHSSNPTSHSSTELMDQARKCVLDYFKASEEEYTVVFTHNASGALKIVGEAYPFTKGGHFLLTFDNHNSVNGIREFARSKGATINYIPVYMPDMRVDIRTLDRYLDMAQPDHANLFAYPAQSNFSGVQHPLEWIARAQEKGWDVLLDSAAFTPTNQLDLSKWHPDYVDLSFYKMFGYPTGVGCLIVKHTALSKLKKPWFAGGTVEAVSIQAEQHFLHEGYEGFEDGTVSYLTLPAIRIGLEHLERIGINLIHEHVMALTDWLIQQLLSLRHTNGKPVIQLYGPSSQHMRGGTVSFNFYDPNGLLIAREYIEQAANKMNISLRTGCFCNPGSIETINNICQQEAHDCFAHNQSGTYEEYAELMKGKVVAAVRVSLGIASNFADVYQFVQFAKSFTDKIIEPEEIEKAMHHGKISCHSTC